MLNLLILISQTGNTILQQKYGFLYWSPNRFFQAYIGNETTILLLGVHPLKTFLLDEGYFRTLGVHPRGGLASAHIRMVTDVVDEILVG